MTTFPTAYAPLRATALLAFACAALLGAPLVQADDEAMDAETFFDDATAMNTGELTAADIALEKDSASQEVRDFAAQLKEDHTAMEQELEQMAAEHNQETSTLADARSMASAGKLMVLSGDTFDSAFVEDQVEAHDRFIEFMERAETELENDELREYASTKLATLQKHREMANELMAVDPDREE